MSEAETRPAPLVVALGADLLFASRLASVVTRAGGSFATARTVEELRARQDSPALVLVDLNARGLDLAAAVRSAREAGAGAVVAYGPHMDVAARRRALDAGCDRWLANSKLFESLPELIATSEKR
jgi:DNA-binding NarL/FixJ family response regulator